MVKGAARPAAPPPSQITSMQSGQNPHDPLTMLNGPAGHGIAHAGFNPFADLGLNIRDPNMAQGMFDNPVLMEQMSAMLQNPAVLDAALASNPQLASMAPQMRQIMQSESFQQMM